jgi:Cu2+-exporting ATPase
MIQGLAIVLASYVSLRFLETYRKARARQVVQQQEGANDNGEKTLVNMDTLASGSEENRKNRHFVKVSTLTIAIASVRRFYAPLTLVSLVAFTYISIPYLRQTEKSLLEKKKVDGYVLYSLADMMMLGLGAITSASIGIGLLHLAKFILSNAKEESKKQVIDVFSHQSVTAWVLKDGVEVEVPIDSIQKNSILVVHAGEVIPVDGIVTEGIAAVDQRILTGESQPADKAAGDLVYASTMIISGKVLISTQKSGKQTTVARIEDVVNNSIDFKGSYELKGEQWADSYTLPILALALLSAPFLGAAGMVGILYCHIANTIRVVAPLGTLQHLNTAVKRGILVKSGNVLEDLKNVDTVIFDKTGTLTQEIPRIDSIKVYDEQCVEEDILFYAATAEQKSVHPIAKAILYKVKDKNMELPEIDDSQYRIGYGVTVNYQNKTIHVGSIRFMKMEGIEFGEEVLSYIDEAYAQGHSVIMVARDHRLCGILEMHTIVRPEVECMIQELRQYGIDHLAIVSGDNERPTRALAESLDMDSYYSEVLPEDKAAIVERLQNEGRNVAFIGDGVNDAIAMKRADVSISLSGAATVATDVAEVVMMDGSLKHLSELFELSASLDRNLSRSLITSLVPNSFALYGVLFLQFNMLAAVLISQSSLVFGAINALLPIAERTIALGCDDDPEIE